MSTKMRYRIFLLLVSSFACAAVGAAHEVTIGQRAKVGIGAELEPGSYQVKVVKNPESCEVLFYRSGDLKLRAPVTLATETKKASLTEVHFEESNGSNVLTRIQLEGAKESLLFNRTPAPSSE